MKNKTLILGIGNILLGDEGVGCHAVKYLKENIRSNNVDIVDGGTGGFHLLSYFSDYSRIIIIDASMDDRPIGTISIIKPKFASDFPTALSAHDVGLRDLIETAVISSGLPDIILITVTIKKIQNMKISLSQPIKESLPLIVKQVKKILNKTHPTY